MRDNGDMGDERLRSEIREEQERIISAVRSATDHWEMAKAEAGKKHGMKKLILKVKYPSATASTNGNTKQP